MLPYFFPAFLMMNAFHYQTGYMYPMWPILWFIAPLAILDLVLKAFALWRSARMGKDIWFIALLLVNSLGILPLLFLLMTKDEYRKVK